MNIRLRYLIYAILIAALALLVVLPATAASVDPVFAPGNPTCPAGTIEVLKIEGNGAAVYNTTQNGITVSSANGVYFDWSSTYGIDAVIAKGGPNGNVYTYDPPAESFGDTGLHSPINSNTGEPFGLSHISFCADFELTATKTANATFTRTYTWDIDKEYDGEYWKFIGDPATTHAYLVSVDQTVVDSNWAVSGIITINNPTPYMVDFSVSDFVNGNAAIVNCPSYTLNAFTSVDCSYSASLGGAVDGTNTATITSHNPNVQGTSANAGYAFGAPTTTIGYPTVDVTDTNGPSWQTSGDASWPYTKDFACPTDQSLYVNGYYKITHVNTATITQTGQSDDATVIVHCYLWDVSKTADGTYNDLYRWEITKTVDPESQSGFAGDTLEWTWTITWESFFVDEINHAVTGVITVTNPAPIALTVDVTDYLTGPVPADSITCNDGDGGTSLTIAAESFGTCDYTAAPDAQLAENTATATRNGVSVSDTVNVNWVQGPDLGLDAEISDSNNIDIPVGSDQPFEYTDEHTCSTESGDYGLDGSYEGDATNTATITWTGGSDSSTADTEFTCFLPSVTKTVNTDFDRYWEWTIVKTADDGSSEFDPLLLQEGQLYEVNYEVTVDATYSDTWQVWGDIEVHNPADIPLTIVDLTDEIANFGNVAVDCGLVEFPYDLPAGQTLECTYDTGLQNGTPVDSTNTATAEFGNGETGSDTKDVIFGDPEEWDECIDVSDTNVGFLGKVCADDVLPKTFEYSLWFGAHPDADVVLECGESNHPNIADFITNDNGNTGEDDHIVYFDVACDFGCTLTPGYWKTHTAFNAPPRDDTWDLVGGENAPFFNSGETWYVMFWTPSAGNGYRHLAFHYMAAKLNVLAGASTTPEVDAAILAAEDYFNATVGIPDVKGKTANELRAIAAVLDAYNNGLIGPGHCDEDANSAD